MQYFQPIRLEDCYMTLTFSLKYGTYSMKQNRSWEDNSHAAGQEITRI
jgi:hypothetical protein